MELNVFEQFWTAVMCVLTIRQDGGARPFVPEPIGTQVLAGALEGILSGTPKRKKMAPDLGRQRRIPRTAGLPTQWWIQWWT